MIRHRRLAVLIVAAATLPLLAGCFNGPRATTSVQATQPTGNGANAMVGDLRVENATLVRGDSGTTGTLIMTIVNVAGPDDALEFVEIGGQQATLSDGSTSLTGVAIPAGQSVAFGYGQEGSPPSLWANTYSLDAAASGYVDVTLLFRDAGSVSLEVLTVPPVGYYEGIAPQPAAPPAG